MKPQGRVYPNQKQVDSGEQKQYDTATPYDKAIFYSGAFDFFGFAPMGVIKTVTLQGRIDV